MWGIFPRFVQFLFKAAEGGGPNWEIPGAGNGFISGGPGDDEGRKLHFIPFRFCILTEKPQKNRERRSDILPSHNFGFRRIT